MTTTDNSAVIEGETAVEELNVLIHKFSKGWHEGIEIDASDIALLCECASELCELRQQLTSEREKVKRLAALVNLLRSEGYFRQEIDELLTELSSIDGGGSTENESLGEA